MDHTPFTIPKYMHTDISIYVTQSIRIYNCISETIRDVYILYIHMDVELYIHMHVYIMYLCRASIDIFANFIRRSFRMQGLLSIGV